MYDPFFGQGMKGPPGMDGEKGVPGIAGPRVSANVSLIS